MGVGNRCSWRFVVLNALVAVSAASVTISNLEPKLDTAGATVNAHDGTYRLYNGSWYYHGAQYGLCREPAKNGCDQVPAPLPRAGPAV